MAYIYDAVAAAWRWNSATIPIGGNPTPELTPLPAQPCTFSYSSTPPVGVLDYAHPGGLVIAGREGYAHARYQSVAAAGGTVLIYLDPIISNATGFYHDKLINASEFGAAVPHWPGDPQANQYGYINDIRVGGTLQSKLEGVLELMVSQNPHMAGWFIDDCGSRTWFPDHDWASWSTVDQQAYRNGAIAICQTVRTVADRHGLIFIVNGTWGAGTLAAAGGGYPSLGTHGCSLADGGCAEHHTTAELPYWQAYGHPVNSQWANDSAYTNGTSFNVAIAANTTDRDSYAASGSFSHVCVQNDYGIIPTPWTSFHANGLPSGVAP